jgi:hypothetical protein
MQPLAYVFWHWRRDSVPRDDYERRQAAFHEALARAPSEGFQRSFSHRLTGAPWANDGGEAYEDWYIVAGSAALDPLGDAAITASRQMPHDRAAAVAAGGTAGLYRLRLGTVSTSNDSAAWFAKPDAMSYADLFAQLEPVVTRANAALWMRQLVLGPMEFCLLSAGGVALPAAITPRVLSLRPVIT